MSEESVTVSLFVAPGIYYDVPFDEYGAWPFMNATTLRAGQRSMMHLRHAERTPHAATPSMTLGHAVHTATLEPDEFPRRYVVRPPTFTNSKGEIKPLKRWSKEGAAHLQTLEQSGTLLSEAEYAECIAIRDAVREHAGAAALLKGRTEVSLAWEDPETRIMCKGRLDVLNERSIVDLKTTRDASPMGFPRELGKYRYHFQAAFYLDACAVLMDNPPEVFNIIAVENKAPYAVCVYVLDSQTIMSGQYEYRKILADYAEACMTGRFPGYPIGWQALSLPNWALVGDDDDD